MISEAWIRQRVRDERYRYSLHADRERLTDILSLDNVGQAFLSGRILEHYKDTGRGESCLVVEVHLLDIKANLEALDKLPDDEQP